MRDRLVDPSDALAVSLEQVQSETRSRLTGIFRADRPPLWSPQVRESLRQEWTTAGKQHILERLQEGSQYARAQGRLLEFQIALFVIFGFSLRALRTRARAKDDYELRDAKKVFERPWAMALVIVLSLTNLLHPLAPRYLGVIPALLISVPVVRIGRQFLISAMAPLAWGLLILFFVDRGRALLDAMPTLERVVSLMQMTGALGMLLWLLHPSRLAKIPAELQRAPFLQILGVAMRVVTALLALAVVADLAGWGDLGILLGGAPCGAPSWASPPSSSSRSSPA